MQFFSSENGSLLYCLIRTKEEEEAEWLNPFNKSTILCARTVPLLRVLVLLQEGRELKWKSNRRLSRNERWKILHWDCDKVMIQSRRKLSSRTFTLPADRKRKVNHFRFLWQFFSSYNKAWFRRGTNYERAEPEVAHLRRGKWKGSFSFLSWLANVQFLWLPFSRSSKLRQEEETVKSKFLLIFSLTLSFKGEKGRFSLVRSAIARV